MNYFKSNEPCIEFIIISEKEEIENYTKITEEEYNQLQEENIKSNGWLQYTYEQRNNREFLYEILKYEVIDADITNHLDLTKPLITYNDEILTCDQCLKLMDYYRDDNEEIFNQLKILRKNAKEYIRGVTLNVK